MQELWSHFRGLACNWTAAVLAAVAQIAHYAGWPDYGTMLVAVLLVSDWILGTTRSVVTNQFDLRKFRRGLIKSAMWGGLLLLAAALRDPSIPGGAYLSGIIIAHMILTDALSCCRNLDAVLVAYDVRIPGLQSLICVLAKLLPQRTAHTERELEP